MPMSEHLLALNLPIGDHVKAGGFNLDTIWSTCVAGAIVIGLGFYLRAKLTSGVPNKVQILWEVVVGTVSTQVDNTLGKRYRHVVPLAVTIFMLVLVANWLAVFPFIWHNTDYLPPPTADVNLTYALGATVFVLTNGASIRAKGVGGYIKGFFVKPRGLFPIRIVEELIKPVTLALRLFGNIFSGTIMVLLLIALPIYFAPATILVSVAWKAFDLFIGLIQAFIFALLTLLYYQFAVAEEGH
jgi:F-type H+-transporting ATPase subunit a